MPDTDTKTITSTVNKASVLKLLPCPFCGSTITRPVTLSNIAWIECHGCLAEGPLAPTERLAVEGWNNRANQIKETTHG